MCEMTRVNCIPPSELTREHLIAEYRELPRIFALVKAAAERGERPDDCRNPRTYTLGSGHCRFFYARCAWLADRYNELVKEMFRRGYRPQFLALAPAAAHIPPEWWGSWEPDEAAMAINRERIAERLNKIISHSG